MHLRISLHIFYKIITQISTLTKISSVIVFWKGTSRWTNRICYWNRLIWCINLHIFNKYHLRLLISIKVLIIDWDCFVELNDLIIFLFIFRSPLQISSIQIKMFSMKRVKKLRFSRKRPCWVNRYEIDPNTLLCFDQYARTNLDRSWDLTRVRRKVLSMIEITVEANSNSCYDTHCQRSRDLPQSYEELRKLRRWLRSVARANLGKLYTAYPVYIWIDCIFDHLRERLSVLILIFVDENN